MDIGLISMAFSQGNINQQASISIMKQAMDQAKGNADFLNKMMGEADLRALQQAAEPHLGGAIDIKG